ncbi:Uncharacterised protein g855 [Pycnogonum litorale]
MEINGRILVYSITGCPHCKRAKSTLSDLKLPYVDVNLEKYPELREEVKQRTQKSSVPQIFFNNIHIGGNDDLQKLIQDSARWEAILQDIIENIPPENAPVPPLDTDDSHENGEVTIDLDTVESRFAGFVKDFKCSGIVKTNQIGWFTKYKDSFSGTDLVNWLIAEKKQERDEAVNTAQLLMNQHYFHHVKQEQGFKDDPNVYYRLLQDEHLNALNSGSTSDNEPLSGPQLGEVLRKLILNIYNENLSDDGKKVDYKGIGGSADFLKYTELTRELQRVDVESMNREEKLAFFINIYNAFVIHANVTTDIPTNLLQRYKFFNCNYYIIGGQQYSLQDIENGVLRGNKRGVGMFSPPFKKNDPRLKVALLSCEPLIHFALVCGAKSCPPIKTYSSNEVISQLRLAAESFLESDEAVELVHDKFEVHLSQIFKWYKNDFGKNDEDLLRWIFEHTSEGEKKNNLGEIIQDHKRKIVYQPYDWGVNSK